MSEEHDALLRLAVNLKMFHRLSEWLLDFQWQAGNPQHLFCQDVTVLFIHSLLTLLFLSAF